MLAQNILTTFLSRVAILLIALASSVVLARFLGPEARGVYALVLFLPEIAGIFSLLGFEQANVVYAGLEPQKRQVLVWHSTIIAAVFGGGIAILGFVLLALDLSGIQSLLRGPLWLYGVALSIVPFALATEYFRAILRGMNRIFMLNVLDIGLKVAGLFLILIVVGWLGLEVVGAVWAEFSLTLLAMAVTVALLGYLGMLGPPKFERSLLGRTTRFALPAHGNTVMSFLNYRVDQIFIVAWLPPQDLGFYVLAAGLAERLWIPTGAVANALLPHLANSPNRDPDLSAVIARHVMVWVGIACLLLFGLADLLVNVLYSSAFAGTVAPLRWMLLGVFSLSIGRILVAELLARKKPHYTFWASSTAAFLNIVGNYFLIPRMGISGAALASSASYTLLSFMLVRFYLKETGGTWDLLRPRMTDVQVYISLWGAGKNTIFPRINHSKSSGDQLTQASTSRAATWSTRNLRLGQEPPDDAK
ncbi:MAG: polysaccharide biosynthesis C-terminal domain-containing protein [Deltaproteobacteria bacterium]|nr:polysaccharide biosynthesis C-terminal domain-containing protein [Deltaproteobacteria bacterium]